MRPDDVATREDREHASPCKGRKRVASCEAVLWRTVRHAKLFYRRHSQKQMHWVHVRHEEAGGFVGGADALLSGKLAACAGSCGPGSLHFINGLFKSHRNRAYVVRICLASLPARRFR